jgi:membrane-bound lytic murein transglycosylase B
MLQKVIPIILVILFMRSWSFASAEADSYLQKRLRANGFPKDFIDQALKIYDSSKKNQVQRLNILGFLLHPDYSTHTSDEGLKKCREFILENQDAFLRAEKEYGVKKEIVVSLLWVESRLGDNQGHFHVTSVYLSLLMGEQVESQRFLQEEAQKMGGKINKSLIAKIKKRAGIKSRWAVGELWALYKMNKENPKVLTELEGSYSGAFGYSQFLPTSFVMWAKGFNKNTPSDLYNPKDAILSVANYLQKNGYRKNKEKTYRKALFRYNKSNDYGNTILKLATHI